MKRLLSLVLAIAMCLSLGVVAFAEYAPATVYETWEEFVAAAEAKTALTLPYSSNAEKFDKCTFEGSDYYQKVYKVDLKKDDVLNIRFDSLGEDDVDVDIYDADFNHKGFFDTSDSYTADVAGIYYVSVYCYDGDPTADFEISMRVIGSYDDELDFTLDPIPTPGEDDLWEYDEITYTLTLKDGFSISTEYDAIVLPEGATVIVEGKADIYSECCGIYGYGDLTIELKAGAVFNIESYCDGIYAYGDMTVEGAAGSKKAELNVYSFWDFEESDSGYVAINGSNGDCAVDISNVKLNIKTDHTDCIYAATVKLTSCELDICAKDAYYFYGYGIYAESEEDVSIEITNCTGKIYSGYYGAIYAYYGSVKIKGGSLELHAYNEAIFLEYGESQFDINIEDCDFYAYSEDDEGLVNYYGDINIKNSNVEIYSYYEAIYCASLNIDEKSTFDFESFGDDENSTIWTVEPFTLPGTFVVEDLDGNELYNGEWTDDIRGEYSYEDDEEDYAKTYYGIFWEENDETLWGSRVYSVESEDDDEEDEEGGFFFPTTSKPGCDHEFDDNNVCTECGVKIIGEVGSEKQEEETNPNTGAGFACGAAALLGAVI